MLLILTKLCNHHHYLITEYFLTQKRNPTPISNNYHSPSLEKIIYFMSL